jgi:hypothetical protein
MMNATRNPAAAKLTGAQIVKAMRHYRVSIREVAAHMQITLKRVREVRALGVTGLHYVLDWQEGVSGAARARAAAAVTQ